MSAAAAESPPHGGSTGPRRGRDNSPPRAKGNIVQLIASLNGPGSDQSRADALVQLAMIVDFSYGEDAAQLCDLLRTQLVLDRIIELVDHPEPLIHQTALLLLGNLSTEAVDPQSELTKQRFKERDGFPKLIPHIFSDQALTVAYALGAIQNTCTDIEYVAHMQQSGAIVRLQDLVQCDQPQIVSYAEAVLHNVMETVMTVSRQLQLTKAAVRIQSSARRRAANKLLALLKRRVIEEQQAARAAIEAEVEAQLEEVGRPEDYADPLAFARAKHGRKAQKQALMDQKIGFARQTTPLQAGKYPELTAADDAVADEVVGEAVEVALMLAAEEEDNAAAPGEEPPAMEKRKTADEYFKEQAAKNAPQRASLSDSQARFLEKQEAAALERQRLAQERMAEMERLAVENAHAMRFVTRLQAIILRRIQQEQLKKLQEERKEAATRMQAFWRWQKTRIGYRQILDTRREAATVIQTVQRAKVARIELKRLRKAKKEYMRWFAKQVEEADAQAEAEWEAAFLAEMKQNAEDFQLADTDGDNMLNFEEFCFLVRYREFGDHTDEELLKRFKQLDVDGSGLIDAREYIKFSLCDALYRSSTRTIDLFRQWDEDKNGTIDKKEFRKAIKALGFDFIANDAEIDMVFLEFDTDRSGLIDLTELSATLKDGIKAMGLKGLRRRPNPKMIGAALANKVRLTLNRTSCAAPTAGALALVPTRLPTLTAPPPPTLCPHPSVPLPSLQVSFQPNPELSVKDQLEMLLSQKEIEVRDLLRYWDEDGNGLVSKSEFRKAVQALGVAAPRADVDAVFAEIDTDNSESIDQRELILHLRKLQREHPPRP